eukprot:352556-Chlamydomonas_euryale.AAC.1
METAVPFPPRKRKRRPPFPDSITFSILVEFESHLLGTAKELWDAVNAYFLNARNGGAIADHRKLIDIHMLEHESVQDYLQQAQLLYKSETDGTCSR